MYLLHDFYCVLNSFYKSATIHFTKKNREIQSSTDSWNSFENIYVFDKEIFKHSIFSPGALDLHLGQLLQIIILKYVNNVSRL